MKAILKGRTCFLLLVSCLGLWTMAAAQPLAQRPAVVYAPALAYPPVRTPAYYSPAPGGWRSWVHMNTPVRGGLFGLGIGAAGGVVLGLSGKDWVLSNGKTVSRPVHAVVDALIVGIPTAVIGSVVGARRERTTLAPTNLHFAIGGGWSGVMAYQSIRNAFDVSGIPNHIPHWFGYLHYPNGENSSTPYTWNLTADYNLRPRHRVGVSFNNFVKQQVSSGTDHHHPGKEYERAMGETYSLVTDYILNPIIPENKTRLVFSAGAGVSYHNLLVRGDLGGGIYEKRRRNVTPHYRAMIEYFSRRSLSLQLKAGYRPRQSVRVPEQSHGEFTLLPHAVNFRSLDVTIGISYHLHID